MSKSDLIYPFLFPLILVSLFLFFTPSEAKDWSQRFYLATYPRSGNHWMRYLIEDATHIATSSVYPDADPPHLYDPFPWEAFSTDGGYRGDSRYPRPNEPFIVKTHYPALGRRSFDRKPYVAVIRIVRHPIDSLYSWYVYKHRNEELQPTIPRDHLVHMVNAWKRFQDYWDRQPRVLTIRYEDMLGDVEACLKQTLSKVGYKYTRGDLEYAVENNQPRGGILKHLNHFTSDDLHYIQEELGPLMKRYNYTMTAIGAADN